MTNKLSKQYNYAELSVLNVKPTKVTNGKQSGNWRVVRDTVWELEGCTSSR